MGKGETGARKLNQRPGNKKRTAGERLRERDCAGGQREQLGGGGGKGWHNANERMESSRTW